MPSLKSIIYRSRSSWDALIMVATFALLAIVGVPTTWAMVAGLVTGLVAAIVLAVAGPKGPGRWTE